MGAVFLFLIFAAVIVGLATGQMAAVTQASVDSAKSAVTLAIGLVGVMAFWLGLVEVLRQAGLMGSLARGLRPVFRRLFPDVPDGHPAVGAMTMNIAANMLGLANAATPMGIKAMRELDTLNGEKGTATDAMCLFLAINTTAVALVPTGVFAIRASMGSENVAGIWPTTLLATTFSTIAGITAAVVLSKLRYFRKTRPPTAAVVASDEVDPVDEAPDAPPYQKVPAILGLILFLVAVAAAVYGTHQLPPPEHGEAWQAALAAIPLPLLILAVCLYGWARGVPVYAALVEGGKEGFQVAFRIIPYLVAILVAIGMFRAAGVLDALISLVSPATSAVGMPPETLPMALLRPFSGSGAYAVMAETMQTHGPDSFIGYIVSTLQGSTETTFYVLAVYGGEVALRRTRHALPACLIGDLCGIIGAVTACHLMLS